MSAPQAIADTNDTYPVCASVLAQNPAWPRAWPEKRAGPAAPKPLRDVVTTSASAAINESSGWWPVLRV
jgi:hypothetical protein